MLDELLRFKIINPLSFELFSNIESLLLEYKYDDHEEELLSYLDKLSMGENINVIFIEVYTKHLMKIFKSVGVDVIDMPIRTMIDILESLQVVSDLDESLSEYLISVVSDSNNDVEAFINIVSEYMKTDAIMLDYQIVSVNSDLIELLIQIISDTELDNSTLDKYSSMRVNIDKFKSAYDVSDMSNYLISFSDITITIEEKIQMLDFSKDNIGLILKKIVFFLLVFDNNDYNTVFENIKHKIPLEYLEQISLAYRSGIEGIING